MAPASSRLKALWTRRKGTILWTSVVILAIVIAAVVGDRTLAGATTPARHFTFSFPESTATLACNCTRVTQTTYAFPTQATINFRWWMTWTGANATAQMAVSTAGGTVVYLSIAEYQEGNPGNLNETWAQGGGGTIAGSGSPFTFLIDVIASPDFLPPDTTIWVNGTYTTPLV
ncbi:MAG: hypothetical protein WA688_10350 [Thermoplasmata archaeon]